MESKKNESSSTMISQEQEEDRPRTPFESVNWKEEEEEEDEEIKEEDMRISKDSEEPRTPPLAPVKYTSVKGCAVSWDQNARHRPSMEDEHLMLDAFGDLDHQGYFAIYDGHGGRDAVSFVAKHLHQNILNFLSGSTDVPESLKNGFLKTDEDFKEAQEKLSRPPKICGTTVVCGLVRQSGTDRELYVANCGDARAVLNRNGVALRLSYDHKATDQAESKRITDLGGLVLLNRVSGVLAVTRSLGDVSLKEYVTGEPYQTKTKLEPTDTHLILACDGLWDVIGDQEAVNMIKDKTDPEEMSRLLLNEALRNGSTDNISIIVVVL